MSIPRALGVAIAVAGAVLMTWSLVGRSGLPAGSPRRLSGAVAGALIICIGVFVLTYWG